MIIDCIFKYPIILLASILFASCTFRSYSEVPSEPEIVIETITKEFYLFKDTIKLIIDVEYPKGNGEVSNSTRRAILDLLTERTCPVTDDFITVPDSGFVEFLADSCFFHCYSSFGSIENNRRGAFTQDETIVRIEDSGDERIITLYYEQKKKIDRKYQENIVDSILFMAYESFDAHTGKSISIEDFIPAENRDSVLSKAITNIKIQIKSKHKSITDWDNYPFLTLYTYILPAYASIRGGCLNFYCNIDSIEEYDYSIPLENTIDSEP